MLKILLRTGVTFVASLAMASTAIAVGTHRCASVADPAERLACYDAAFPPSTGAASLESEREKALREFGLSRVQQRAHEPEAQRNARPERIEGSIAAIRSLSSTESAVTLDNGQQWLLSGMTARSYLAKGDHIVIRTAAVGTFMLITPRRIAVRAKRLK